MTKSPINARLRLGWIICSLALHSSFVQTRGGGDGGYSTVLTSQKLQYQITLHPYGRRKLSNSSRWRKRAAHFIYCACSCWLQLQQKGEHLAGRCNLHAFKNYCGILVRAERARHAQECAKAYSTVYFLNDTVFQSRH